MSKGNGQSSDNDMLYILLAIVGFATLFVVDWLYGSTLRRWLLWIYGAELWVAGFPARLFGFDYAEVVNYAFSAPGSRVYWSDVLAIGQAANAWWRWLLAPTILFVGWQVSRRMPGATYSGPLGLEQFIGYQAKFWKFIAPFVSFNPEKSKNPADRPALSPREYAKPAERDGEIDEGILRTMLTKQLRTPWTKPEALPEHMQILYAMFALKCADNKDWDPNHPEPDSRKMIRETVQQLQFDAFCSFDPSAVSVGNEKTRDWVARVFANKSVMARAAQVARRHAYAETVLLSLLEYARLRGGVFAPAEFRWLKSIDRSLWYALDDSRPPKDTLAPFSGTFHPEGAGIIAHWLAEKTFSAPIAEPFVEGAHSSLIKWIRDHD